MSKLSNLTRGGIDGYDLGIRGNEVVTSGKHTSIRVALAVPPKVHEQLAAWADYEGRPMASLCMYLIEQSLREAQAKGIAPSFKDESNKEGDRGWVKDGPEPDDWVKQLGKQAVQDRAAEFFQAEGSTTTEEWVNQENEVNTAVGREAAKGRYIKPDEELSKKDLLLQKLAEVLLD